MSFYEKILKSECKVIDLSADFRIKNTNTWEKFYNLKHCVSNHANVTVYGLSEFYRNEIQSSQIIANGPTESGISPGSSVDIKFERSGIRSFIGGNY